MCASVCMYVIFTRLYKTDQKLISHMLFQLQAFCKDCVYMYSSLLQEHYNEDILRKNEGIEPEWVIIVESHSVIKSHPAFKPLLCFVYTFFFKISCKIMPISNLTR